MQYVLELVTAFLGTLGFALLFHVRRERLLPACLGGILAWGVYLLMGLVVSADMIRYFVAAVVLTIYAEVMARVLKCPATLFIIVAVIPLVPGGALYGAMYHFVKGDFAASSAQGVSTLLLAVAIAAGMLFPMSLFQLVRRTRELKAQEQKKQDRKAAN